MPDLDRFATVLGRQGAAACDAVMEYLSGECTADHARAMVAKALDEAWRHLPGIRGAREALHVLEKYCTIEARQGDMFAPAFERSMDHLAQAVGKGTLAEHYFLRVTQQCLQRQIFNPTEVFQMFGETVCRIHFGEAREGLLQRMSAEPYSEARGAIATLCRPVIEAFANRLAAKPDRTVLNLSRDYLASKALTADDLVPM